MKIIRIISALALYCGIALASQKTDDEKIRFSGFARLFSDTNVISVVQFEDDSSTNFKVIEVLYPRGVAINDVFAPYGGVCYGIVSPDYGVEFAPQIVPGGAYIVFLKRVEGGSRSLYYSKNFMLPAYAGSYAFASDYHAVVPLFDLKSSTYAPLRRYRQSQAAEKEAEARRLAKILRDQYGTDDGSEILAALRSVIEIASRREDWSAGRLRESLPQNKPFRQILKDVTDESGLKKGVLEHADTQFPASKEPPARAQDSSALRNSFLNKVKIERYKSDGESFSVALDKLERAIRSKSGYENFKFVIDPQLQKELKRAEPKVYIDVEDSYASVLVEFVADGMFVRVIEDKIIYIELL